MAVSGRLQTSSYTDSNTNKNVYTTEVITENVQFLDSKKKETSALTGEIPNQTVNQTSIKSNEVLSDFDYNQIGFDVNDDDLYPF